MAKGLEAEQVLTVGFLNDKASFRTNLLVPVSGTVYVQPVKNSTRYRGTSVAHTPFPSVPT